MFVEVGFDVMGVDARLTEEELLLKGLCEELMGELLKEDIDGF
ncbi:hypothetical protein [Staphylococcus auricularis]|nr:hypothetical protein [Staphylococcus auricularis]